MDGLIEGLIIYLLIMMLAGAIIMGGGTIAITVAVFWTAGASQKIITVVVVMLITGSGAFGYHYHKTHPAQPNPRNPVSLVGVPYEVVAVTSEARDGAAIGYYIVTYDNIFVNGYGMILDKRGHDLGPHCAIPEAEVQSFAKLVEALDGAMVREAVIFTGSFLERPIPNYSDRPTMPAHSREYGPYVVDGRQVVALFSATIGEDEFVINRNHEIGNH